jgi:hypothetical protein
LATAAVPVTTFDPYRIGLGAEIETPEFYFGESPFGYIVRARRANGEIYSVYSTEHTTPDYLAEMWAELPQSGLNYYSSIQCRKVPSVFGRRVKKAYIHYYATHRRGLLIGINKTEFFSAQGVFGLQ